MSEYHTPVLLTESVSALVTNPSGIYADATFGGGGHTAGVLSRLHEDGFVIAFDRDIQALDNKIDDPRLILIHNNFRFIHNYGVLAWRKGLAALSAGEQLTAGAGEQPTAGVGKQLTAKAGVASGRPSGSFAETREYALSPEGLPEATPALAVSCLPAPAVGCSPALAVSCSPAERAASPLRQARTP